MATFVHFKKMVDKRRQNSEIHWYMFKEKRVNLSMMKYLNLNGKLFQLDNI